MSCHWAGTFESSSLSDQVFLLKEHKKVSQLFGGYVSDKLDGARSMFLVSVRRHPYPRWNPFPLLSSCNPENEVPRSDLRSGKQDSFMLQMYSWIQSPDFGKADRSVCPAESVHSAVNLPCFLEQGAGNWDESSPVRRENCQQSVLKEDGVE